MSAAALSSLLHLQSQHINKVLLCLSNTLPGDEFFVGSKTKYCSTQSTEPARRVKPEDSIEFIDQQVLLFAHEHFRFKYKSHQHQPVEDWTQALQSSGFDPSLFLFVTRSDYTLNNSSFDTFDATATTRESVEGVSRLNTRRTTITTISSITSDEICQNGELLIIPFKSVYMSKVVYLTDLQSGQPSGFEFSLAAGGPKGWDRFRRTIEAIELVFNEEEAHDAMND